MDTFESLTGAGSGLLDAEINSAIFALPDFEVKHALRVLCPVTLMLYVHAHSILSFALASHNLGFATFQISLPFRLLTGHPIRRHPVHKLHRYSRLEEHGWGVKHSSSASRISSERLYARFYIFRR